MFDKAPILELRNVSKSFGSVRALVDVSMQLYPGEILCLLGDNGAGKSTLIKILSGYHPPSTGALAFEGRETRFAGPRDARLQGIATVHQDVGSIPMMSVGRNFFLGAEPMVGPRFLRIFDRRRANAAALEQIRRFGITRVTNGEQFVGTMSGGERQVLAIGRAMYFGAKVLILDEPTSALGVKEAAIVLKQIRQVRSDGVAVIFITHNVQHAIAAGDRFVVLIHGGVAASFRRGEKSREEILNLMAGGEQMLALEQQLGETA
jgi:simple sugar transport system ATP-binding protein